MNLIQGSIAFALALAGLATLCTVLIEILHRLFGLRASGLRVMLAAYFDGVLTTRLPPQELAALKKDFLDSLTVSALMKQLGEGWSWLPGFVRRRLLDMDTLSAPAFLARLQESASFKRLIAAAPGQEEALLKDLGERYDQYCQATTDYFKSRAHLLSLLAGVALAVLGNIHAGRIFDTFVKNPDLAQRMEAQAGNIHAALAALNGNASNVAAPSPNIGAELAAVRATLHDYQNLGLPVGWNHYPNCLAGGNRDPHCAAIVKTASATDAVDRDIAAFVGSLLTTLRRDLLGLVEWAVVVIFTGLLIGLGGPFWYDLAMRLSAVRQAFAGKAAPPPERD